MPRLLSRRIVSVLLAALGVALLVLGFLLTAGLDNAGYSDSGPPAGLEALTAGALLLGAAFVLGGLWLAFGPRQSE